MPDDPDLEKSIEKDQENASSDLGEKEESSDPQDQKEKLSKAQKNQKKAGQKMQQMSQQMAQQMSSSGGQQMSEDIDVLRQILDNLLLFSFDQETLMNRFKQSTTNPAGHAKHLVKQSNLREHFEHVEDSLFALSLRQPMISESINKEITEVFFNIDKSIDLLSENSFREAVAAQQFAITATNKLADMLSNSLDSLEMQMQMSSGQGDGEQQLPDIIMSQEALSKQMEKQLEKGKKSKGEQEGSKQKEGQETKGARGKDRQQGNSSQQDEDSEEDNGELFEIFKKQQELRNALQDLIDKKGIGDMGQKLLDSMENIEQNLINQGLTEISLQIMQDLKHQLLKLDKAVQQQGEDAKRISNTSKADRFQAPTPSTETIKQYFNTIEILNRQSLPLRQEFKQKVQEYFKINND